MTTIELVANDQLLQVTVNPKISSGEVNTVKVHVDFSDDWEGFGKSAVFYTAHDQNSVYEIVMTNDECIVPSEVMSKSGTLYIGIRGVNSDKNEIKTTSLVKYKILEGTPTGNSTEVEPTPDVYQQLLTAIDHGIVILKETNKGNGLKFWVGTQAEYNALDPKPQNTFCIISDDTSRDELRINACSMTLAEDVTIPTSGVELNKYNWNNINTYQGGGSVIDNIEVTPSSGNSYHVLKVTKDVNAFVGATVAIGGNREITGDEKIGVNVNLGVYRGSKLYLIASFSDTKYLTNLAPAFAVSIPMNFYKLKADDEMYLQVYLLRDGTKEIIVPEVATNLQFIFLNE